MLFFFGLHGLTSTAQGAIALVGDNVRGTSLTPPLDDSIGFGGTESPSALDPASKKVDPGSLMTEFDWDETVGFADLEFRIVSTERAAWSDEGRS
jgi:hypothetical protein